MQPSTLSLIAFLAPASAAAFGDLDCITITSCGNSGCGPETTPLSITFNWADDTVTVTALGMDHTLDWVATGGTDDGLGSLLEYGDMDDTNRLLRIEASGAEITAFYTFRSPRMTTWEATCNVRQAA